LFSIVPIILLLGAMLLLLFTVLAGARTGSPLDKFYFLQAQLSADGLSSPSGFLRWTTWNICGQENGNNVNCGKIQAAHPFAPARQLTNASPSLPTAITSNDTQSYITSRAFFAFLLMGLFFTFVALLASLVGCLGRLGGFIGLLTAFVAFIFDGIAAALMTVVYIRGRSRFRDAGIPADVGVKLFAFMWTATAICLICAVLFAVAACIPSDKPRRTKR
ncbi:actin cortical patch SUR7/pH-response regulator pali, partial [Protomyces lactucae-debilis]